MTHAAADKSSAQESAAHVDNSVWTEMILMENRLFEQSGGEQAGYEASFEEKLASIIHHRVPAAQRPAAIQLIALKCGNAVLQKTLAVLKQQFGG